MFRVDTSVLYKVWKACCKPDAKWRDWSPGCKTLLASTDQAKQTINIESIWSINLLLVSIWVLQHDCLQEVTPKSWLSQSTEAQWAKWTQRAKVWFKMREIKFSSISYTFSKIKKQIFNSVHFQKINIYAHENYYLTLTSVQVLWFRTGYTGWLMACVHRKPLPGEFYRYIYRYTILICSSCASFELEFEFRIWKINFERRPPFQLRHCLVWIFLIAHW